MVQAFATLDESVDESAASPVHPEEQSGWTARPGVALILRSLIFLAPILASVGASYLVARSWSRPEGLVATIGWMAVLMTVGGAAMIGIDRFARRLLPLTALMQMTLIFPDQAPSRFSIALRSGTTKQLEARLDKVRQYGLGETEAEAAETLLHLAAALREHDRFTRGHGERVRAYTALIGEQMGLGPVELSKLQWAGLIHDIGKLAIPEEVLNKPGRLTAAEYDLIKTHPAEGMALMGPLTGWLGEWALAVGEHHERWDGGGYPNGLAGTQISLAGRIVAVADTFDVITATRSYKPAQSPQWARRELANNAGTQFDPEVVRAFLNLSLGQLRGVMWPLSWIAHLPFIGSAVTAPASGVAVAAATVVSSSLTGGSLAGAVPPDDGPIPHTEPSAVVEEDSDVAAPGTTDRIAVQLPSATTTTIVARLPVDATRVPTPTTAENDEPVADAPPAIIVVTTPPPADGAVGGFSEAATGAAPIVITPPVSRQVTISEGGETVITGTTTPPATGGMPAPTTTAVPTTTVVPATTTAPTTTAAPTTTVAATACDQARAGATSLAGADLANCDLSGVTLAGVDLTGANLTGANLRGAEITNTTLDNATLTRADLTGAIVTGGSMTSVDAADLIAEGAVFKNVDLSGSRLVDADFSFGTFVFTSFESVIANGIDFEGSTLEDVSFDGAAVSDSQFDESIHLRVTMQNATARQARFQLADMRGIDLRGTNLRESELAEADLTGARLDGARFTETNLQEANFRGATGRPTGAASAEYNDTICPSGAVQSTNCWP